MKLYLIIGILLVSITGPSMADRKRSPFKWHGSATRIDNSGMRERSWYPLQHRRKVTPTLKNAVDPAVLLWPGYWLEKNGEKRAKRLYHQKTQPTNMNKKKFFSRGKGFSFSRSRKR